MLTLAFMYCLKHPFAVAMQDAWPGKYAVICNSGYADSLSCHRSTKNLVLPTIRQKQNVTSYWRQCVTMPIHEIGVPWEREHTLTLAIMLEKYFVN